MPVLAPVWSADLFGRLQADNFLGSELMSFTDAVGNGSQLEVVGAPFTTTDVGSTPGAGTGVGVGITGIDPSLAASTIFSTALSLFGQSGSRLLDLANHMGDTLEAQMLLADLASTHAPVFLGTGTVDIGSIGVADASWASSIESAAPGFIGSEWPNFALAIGTGYATAVLAGGTGTVVISGAGGIPVPGAGTGVGIIS